VKQFFAALFVAGVLLAGCRHAKEGSARDEVRALLARDEPERALKQVTRLRKDLPEDYELARLEVEAAARANQGEGLLARLERIGRPSAIELYMRGLARFAVRGNAEGAAEAFTRGIALRPEEPELHHRLGLVYLEAEQHLKAVEPLRRAVELAPKRAGYRVPWAKALHRTGDTAGAIEALRGMLTANPSAAELASGRRVMEAIADPFGTVPSSARKQFEEGLRWLQEVDVPQEAITAFEAVLRDFPDLAVAHALLGLAYQRIDDAGRAIEEYRKAIALAPHVGRTYEYLGELYLARQRPEQAEEAFAQAVAKNPLLDAPYFRLGDLALERRDLPAAEKAFRAAALLSPGSPAAHGKLALVLQLKEDYAGAERELRHVLAAQPENLEFKLRLGLLYAERRTKATRAEDRRRDGEQAARWLKEVLAEQPDNAAASRALESLRGS
jgi:tetratricopeptide (TPR) repeat protein